MRRLHFLVLFITAFLAHPQEADQQIVDYTYSFLRNIKWPQEKEVYNVRVITQDRSLTVAFEELAKSAQVNGKPINMGFSSYVSIPEKVDVLFVSSQYNGALQTIIDRIGGKPILIITEQSTDQQYVMINLVRNVGGDLAFEFNRANMINQGLRTSPGFDQLGGEEINVAKLYRQFRDSVRSMENRSKFVRERVDSLNMNAALAMKIANDQFKQLEQQTKEIERRQQQLDNQSEILDSLTAQLEDRETQLAKLGDEIRKQEASIDEGDKTLREQENLIQQRNQEIAERETKLQQMVTIVDSQQDTLILLILFSVFLVVVLVFAYRAYQARRRAAKTLNQQKEELKELLDELQSTQTQLVQSEKMASLGVLTAGIAHEINNAINYVYSGIHVLDGKFSEIRPLMHSLKELDVNDTDLNAKLKVLGEQKSEIDDSFEEVIDTMIKSIRIGAERTIDIVKGLRTFSRAQEETMSEIDIHEDIDVALLLLRNKIRHTISIEKELAGNLPKMYGYSGQIGQAILNIVGNAIDACADRKDSRILIKTVFSMGKVEIVIKDNGIGIRKEDMDKIFDPFYTTKKIGEGTGLGLSITYGIIEKHNGTISVDSKIGEGTKFKIELPLNDQPLNY